MKNTETTIETKNKKEYLTDLNLLLEKIIKEIYPEIQNRKILLNTAYCHKIFIKTDENTLKKFLYNIFYRIVKLSPEKSRIVVNTDTKEKEYVLTIGNNLIKEKIMADSFFLHNKELLDKYGIVIEEYGKEESTHIIYISFPANNS